MEVRALSGAFSLRINCWQLNPDAPTTMIFFGKVGGRDPDRVLMDERRGWIEHQSSELRVPSSSLGGRAYKSYRGSPAFFETLKERKERKRIINLRRPMKKIIASLTILFLVSGCATTVKKSPFFDARVDTIKTIAVMPSDVKVYQLTAGGVREEIDEWSDKAKELTRGALEKYLGDKAGYHIKFIDKEWLKSNYKELWDINRALYEAVSISAIMHAYTMTDNSFPAKVKDFDYTLGSELKELAVTCDADALLFVYGFNHEATAGRTALFWFSMIIGGPVPINPSLMTIGLVDAGSGDIDWFNIHSVEMGDSFRHKEHIDRIMAGMLQDFLKKDRAKSE